MIFLIVTFLSIFLSPSVGHQGQQQEQSTVINERESLNRQTRFGWTALCNFLCDESVDPDYYLDSWDYKFDGRVFCTQLCGHSVPVPTRRPATQPGNKKPGTSSTTTTQSSASSTDSTDQQKKTDAAEEGTTEKTPATDFQPTPKATSTTAAS